MTELIVPRTNCYLLATEDANELCRKGNLIVLQYFVEILKVFPDVEGANLACEYGNLDILKFLKVNNIFPDTNGANMAADNGYMEILHWCESYKILPNAECTLTVVLNEHIEVLNFLAKYNIFPDAEDAHFAIKHDKIRSIEWLNQNTKLKIFHQVEKIKSGTVIQLTGGDYTFNKNVFSKTNDKDLQQSWDKQIEEQNK